MFPFVFVKPNSEGSGGVDNADGQPVADPQLVNLLNLVGVEVAARPFHFHEEAGIVLVNDGVIRNPLFTDPHPPAVGRADQGRLLAADPPLAHAQQVLARSLNIVLIQARPLESEWLHRYSMRARLIKTASCFWQAPQKVLIRASVFARKNIFRGVDSNVSPHMVRACGPNILMWVDPPSLKAPIWRVPPSKSLRNGSWYSSMALV